MWQTSFLSPLNLFGYAFFFASLFVYSALSYRDKQGTLRYPRLPTWLAPCACCEPERADANPKMHVAAPLAAPAKGAVVSPSETSKLIAR